MKKVVFRYNNRLYTIPERKLSDPRVRYAIAIKRVTILKGMSAVRRAGIKFGGYRTYVKHSPNKKIRHLKPIRRKRKRMIRPQILRIPRLKPMIEITRTRPVRGGRKKLLLKKRRRRFFGRKSLTGVEMMHLHNVAKKHGLAKDLFDWRAHIDTSLGFQENKTQIEKKIRAVSGPKEDNMILDMAQFNDAFASHVDNLKFLVEGGDEEAKKELRAMKLKGVKI